MKTTLMTLTAIGTTVFASMTAMAQLGGAAPGRKAPHLNVRLLPSGPDADAAEARAIVDGTSNTMMVGGAVRAANVWRPVYWQVSASSTSVPQEMPHETGGRVNAAVIIGSAEYFCAFVGTTFDDQGVDHPALWVLGTAGNDTISLIDLPTPSNHGGEALRVATGDINGDGAAEIIVCGWSMGLAQTARATLWVGTPEDGFVRQVLPSLVPDGDAQAIAISVSLNESVVCGTATDGNGTPQAVMWTMNSQAPAIEALCDLPAGFGSTAQDIEVENDETHWVGHAIISPAGIARPALSHDTTRGTWETQPLPLIGGMNTGRVNSIIAILIGLLAGGEGRGPDGPSAMIWVNQDEIPPAAIDLNRVASNRPAGVRLERVQMILPYIEQDNVFKFVGDARHAAGLPVAFFGVLHLD